MRENNTVLLQYCYSTVSRTASRVQSVTSHSCWNAKESFRPNFPSLRSQRTRGRCSSLRQRSLSFHRARERIPWIIVDPERQRSVENGFVDIRKFFLWGGWMIFTFCLLTHRPFSLCQLFLQVQQLRRGFQDILSLEIGLFSICCLFFLLIPEAILCFSVLHMQNLS